MKHYVICIVLIACAISSSLLLSGCQGGSASAASGQGARANFNLGSF